MLQNNDLSCLLGFLNHLYFYNCDLKMRKMDKWPNQSMIVLNIRLLRASFMVIVVYIFSWNLRENSYAAKWHGTWSKNWSPAIVMEDLMEGSVCFTGNEAPTSRSLISEFIRPLQISGDKPELLSVKPTFLTRSRAGSPARAFLSEVANSVCLHPTWIWLYLRSCLFF